MNLPPRMAAAYRQSIADMDALPAPQTALSVVQTALKPILAEAETIEREHVDLLREVLSRFEELRRELPSDASWWTAGDRRAVKTMEKVRAVLKQHDGDKHA